MGQTTKMRRKATTAKRVTAPRASKKVFMSVSFLR
jgi:hypothetical protein